MKAFSVGKYARIVSRRSISTFSDSQLSKMSLEEWGHAFKGATHDLAAMDVDNITYADSSSRLRSLIQSRLLRHDDLYKYPERFFLAHRLIAEHAASLGPGFWVRFTVHYNLCVGTVLELGGPEHLQDIHEMQDKGLLGCFGLTERLAGVSSGLIVETTADWDSSNKTFVLNTPTPGAAKNWISQGFVADKVVVVADLKIKNKSFGPHAFFTELRKNGEVVNGVKLVDMGRKTVGNDLDNARISFDNVIIPKSAMLNRFADVSDEKYIQKVDGLPAFHMIGQRLFSGRVAVAQAALTFRKSLFARTKKHSDSKQCWFPKQTRPLSSFPHLAHLYSEDHKNTQKFETFLAKVESELSNCLKSKKLPSPQLVETIAAAKVLVVEDCISAVHQLQNEVGSFALMHGTGFEQRDFLTCCKFAEGDSRILMQKIARDRLRLFQKKQLGSSKDKWDEETKLCSKLHELIEKDPLEWDKNWRDVDVLANLVMNRTVNDFMSK